ncbi:MAG TPA: RpiB/LacA/LacB family sugar-phosphate isomerase [Candidatus Paceibacterota bacterium]|nr:RpiB/LacA/LacB family sugar-phosphate isomerase [Candidatus Paceibacterota bacterium]
MKIYLAGDHAGYRLKAALAEHLPILGHEVEDLGPHELAPADDYPEYVTPLAERVAREPGACGIVCAGSGEGEAMCANRVKGARAAVYYGRMRVTEALDAEGAASEDGYDIVRLARRHNDANILSIGARFVPPAEADEAVRIFLATEFSSDPRHARRLAEF